MISMFKWSEKIKNVMRIAYEAHKDQYDKSGVPYIFHLVSVASAFEDEDAIIVGLLHDYIEDTCRGKDIEEVKQSLIDKGLSEIQVEAIVTLTHVKNEPYNAYIQRVAKNSLAAKVKIADIENNSDPERLKFLYKQERDRLMSKYENAKKLLEEELAKQK